MTTENTVTLYAIGKYAADEHVAEFKALRDQFAAADPDAIAMTNLNGAIETSTVVSDYSPAGVDLWGKGFAEEAQC